MKKISILLVCSSLLAALTTAHAQTCNNTQKITPDDRFEDLKDGTVKDKQTGLTWQRCSIGQKWMNGKCTGEAKELTWHEALTEAKKVGNGWRLPNIKEIASISEPNCAPGINLNIFPDLDNYTEYDDIPYWSSTSFSKKSPYGAMIYYFNFGTSELNVVPYEIPNFEDEDAPAQTAKMAGRLVKK